MRWLFLFLSVFTVIVSATPAAAQSSDLTLEERTLIHDGLTRRYLLYVPPQYDPAQAMPLVFVMHGGGGSPEIYSETTGFTQKAHDEGFILVYPAGTGRRNAQRLLTWNAGHCCGFAQESGVDDIGFFRAMVDELTAEFSIDPNRIYAAGHSNGAILSYWLAAEMSDVFAAVGIVAGTIGGYPTPQSTELYIIPQPAQPVSVLHIHGMADVNLRYEGGVNDDDTLSSRNDLSVAESIDFWVKADGCDPLPQTENLDEGMVLVDRYDCTASGTAVTLISIVDGGHSWPSGTAPRRTSDPPSQRVNATDEIWAFFAAHPRITPTE